MSDEAVQTKCPVCEEDVGIVDIHIQTANKWVVTCVICGHAQVLMRTNNDQRLILREAFTHTAT